MREREKEKKKYEERKDAKNELTPLPWMMCIIAPSDTKVLPGCLCREIEKEKY